MKKNNPTYIITHHSNGTVANKCASTHQQSVYHIDDWHKKQWKGFTSKRLRRKDNGEFWHCGYHLVTDLNTGVTTKTRGFYEEGAHCIGMNTSSIGWLFIGNYTECSPDEIDRDIAKREFFARAPGIMKEFNIPIQNIVPHRHFAQKDCHGSKLSDDYFRNFLLEERVSNEVTELRGKVERLEAIVQGLQRLVVMLINMLSTKRLSSREIKNKA